MPSVAKAAINEHAADVSAEPERAEALALANAESGRGAASPALALQEQLAGSLALDDRKFPARYVTSTIIVGCIASWYAVYLLANALI